MAAKIVIADDHSMIREGLKQLLEMDGGVEVIAEAGNGMECLEVLEKVIPQVLLLDINMPVMNGLEVLKKIKKENMDIKVIILTVHNEIEYLLKAVEFGIDGYILKESDSSELRKAIFNVISGETYIQPNLIPLLNAKMVERDIEKEKIDLLTKRNTVRH